MGAAVLGLSLVSCSTPLTILHVNDTHSHLEPARDAFCHNQGGVIERAFIVDEVREKKGADNVLLLHAGDFNQGTSYYTEFEGELEVQVVNAMGYDCITLGNHEFDDGMEHLAKRLAKIECPVVCANLKLEGTPLEGIVKPYTIVEKAGRKIGIIGLIPNNIRTVISASVAEGIVQYNSVEVVNKYATQLKEQDGCDLVILLSHLGLSSDKYICRSIKDVDIIVGGHSHDFIKKPIYRRDYTGHKVCIVTDGCWGLEVGELIVR